MCELKEKIFPSSSMGATCFVQPLDLVKNRMQVAVSKEHKTSMHVLRHVIKTEGAMALYSGLSAGLLRQATYTTTRLGVYTYLFERASGWVTYKMTSIYLPIQGASSHPLGTKSLPVWDL